MQHAGTIKLSRNWNLTMLASIPDLIRSSIGKLKARHVYQMRVTQADDWEGRKCAAMAQSKFWADLLLRPNSGVQDTEMAGC